MKKIKINVSWQVKGGFSCNSIPQHTEFEVNEEFWNSLSDERQEQIMQDKVAIDFAIKVTFERKSYNVRNLI